MYQKDGKTIEYSEDVSEQSNGSSFVMEEVVSHLKASKRKKAIVNIPHTAHESQISDLSSVRKLTTSVSMSQKNGKT